MATKHQQQRTPSRPDRLSRQMECTPAAALQCPSLCSLCANADCQRRFQQQRRQRQEDDDAR